MGREWTLKTANISANIDRFFSPIVGVHIFLAIISICLCLKIPKEQFHQQLEEAKEHEKTSVGNFAPLSHFFS